VPAPTTPAQPVPPAALRRGRLDLIDIERRAPGSRRLLLGPLTLRCEPGEFVVVVGPSGCGKTTLLHIAAGMTAPTRGRATLDGRPVTGPGPDRAMVFQQHGLFPWLTAAQNVEFGLRMLGLPAPERRARVESALRMVGLQGAAGLLIHQLSGGMSQRIAIARALVVDPAVLLMDEPFAALDAQTRTLLHDQLQRLWSQTRNTVLFVTHSVGEAVRLADRVIVMSAGPGLIRKEFPVRIPHPRPMDSPELADLGHLVRAEIQDEVARLNGHAAPPPTPVPLG
jgi:ABC-type nitrate/sulfonate/bicarbonate transport system ATPase subunit